MMIEFFVVLGVFYLGFTTIILVAQHRDESKAHRLERESAATETEVVELRSVQNLNDDV